MTIIMRQSGTQVSLDGSMSIYFCGLARILLFVTVAFICGCCYGY